MALEGLLLEECSTSVLCLSFVKLARARAALESTINNSSAATAGNAWFTFVIAVATVLPHLAKC